MKIINKLNGTVVKVLLGLEASSLVTTAQAQVKVTFAGLEGDRHAGLTHKSDSRTPNYRRGTEIRNARQVSLISVEELQEIARRMDLSALEPEWLGANLLIEGIPDLTMIPPSSRLYFPDDTVLVIDSENDPCIHPGKVIQSHFPERSSLVELFVESAKHLRGLVAWVERPGTINQADQLRFEIPQISGRFMEELPNSPIS
ncbi:MAG: MOSC domain-containing protein [Negativicutes bacterium]|nr:MOSC domain-containing protein [Negativicutes bacterium]